MLCEKCGKNLATTHIKTSINGVVESHHLCAQCAKMSAAVQNQFGLEDLLGSFFGETVKAIPHSDKRKRCDGCGMCFDDIVQSGRVGCDRCYSTFLEQLLPSLQRMHGKAYHAGKKPRPTISAAPTREQKLESLREELKAAVDAEQFEEAAKLRDQIKELQKEEDQHE